MSFFCSEFAQSFLLKNVSPANFCYQENPSQNIENLRNWQIGFLSPKVEIYEGKFGLGIFANDQIDSGEILLSIKKESLINVEKAFLVSLIAYSL